VELRDATFNCTSLPSCTVSCFGPHRKKLKRVTRECTCIGEWSFHSYWLSCVLSLLIYLILNISRVTFIDGLSRMFWNHLHPGSFTVYGTCNESGAFVLKEDEKINKEESDPHMQQDISSRIIQQLDSISFKFRMTGLVMVLASISVNSLWVFIVVRLKNDLSLKWL